MTFCPLRGADGLVVFVWRACRTCILIEKQMQAVARRVPKLRVVSQDDPRFPAAVEGMVEDREFDHSRLDRAR